MDRVVFNTLRPLSLGFGLFIGYTAARDVVRGEHWLITAADVAVAAYLLVLAAVLFWRPPDMRWMNGLGSSVALVLGGTDMVTMAVRGGVPDFPATTLVLAGLGAVVLSWPVMLATIATLWTAWLAVTQGFTDNPWQSQFILQIATIAGLAIHGGRHRAYAHLIEARDSEAAAKERLLAVNQELDRFASVVAHDLKSPVAAVKLKAGTLRVLLKGEEKPMEILLELDHVADGMAQMIDDLLQYARAGAELHRRPTDLQEICDGLEEVFQDQLDAAQGRLDMHDLSVVDADPTQLRQLVQNLVGNALQHRRAEVPPVVEISTSRRGQGTEIRIKDNGQGFDPAMTERLFQPFERGDTEAPGHGLGLATCRRIVDGHGGRIDAESTPGEGSVFKVWLPDASTSGAPPGGEKGERGPAGPTPSPSV